MPRLRRLTGDIEVAGPINTRPADLYVSKGHRQAGSGIAAGKIAQFYGDPVERGYDEAAASFAHQLRSMSIEEGFTWSLQRNLRFIARAAIGSARRLGMIAIADHVASEECAQRLRSLGNRA
jgi:hypothetical protein